MNKQQKIRQIAGIALLSALTAVLSFISNYIVIGSVSINLSLIPIVLAAIIYGPYAALFVGAVNGAIVILAPSTQIVFFPINVLATILVCLLKTSIGGLISSLLYRWLSKRNIVLGIIIATICVPVINTSLFVLTVLIFFPDLIAGVITIMLLINFAIELSLNIILAPSIIRIIKILKN